MRITGILVGMEARGGKGGWINIEGLRIHVRDPRLLEIAEGLLRCEVVAHVMVRYYRSKKGGWFTKLELQAIQNLKEV